MLSAGFESKLGLKTPKARRKYTLADAQADAALLLANTEDRAYPLGRLEPLLHDPDSSLHESVQAHYDHLKVLSLGCAYSAQILGTAPAPAAGTDMDSSSAFSLATAATHADAVGSIGGGASALCDVLPLNISLPAAYSSSIGSGSAVGNAPLSAATLKQLSKDLARDRLIINGRYVVGAEAGMQGIQAMVRACCV